jgi:hypothetical protein
MRYQIKSKNVSEHVAILSILAIAGYRNVSINSDENPNVFLKSYLERGSFEQDFETWPYSMIRIEGNLREVSGSKCGDTMCKDLSFEEFISIDWSLSRGAKVKLNNNHTALVYKDKVIVGCQEFPIDVIDKLVRARNGLKS